MPSPESRIPNPDPRVAIVGMGAVLPGAVDLAGFWRMVADGASAMRDAPPGRWTLPVKEALARGIAPDRVYSAVGCFLDDDQTRIERLATLAGRAGLEVDVGLLAALDPLYRLLIIAGVEAWRDAVTSPLDRRRVGAIVGNIALPTVGASLVAERKLGFGKWAVESGQWAVGGGQRSLPTLHSLDRFVAGLPAELLASSLGLCGGAYALDAACASSLYALKLAADELLAGRADAMLAGGVSRPDCLYTQMGFSQLRALSASGRCAPFDHRADGLVVGEGAGVFVLKRLGDALAHGDRIYATILGCGLANDVGGNLMSPDSEGQLRAMWAAYRSAGISPHEVDLIECHGTGTPVGDAVEFRSLRTLWRNADPARRCAIGSVKSNVGHLLTGAGAAGLAKVLLALLHKTLPPSANFERAGNDIALDDSPFRVLDRAAEWPERPDGQPRRAAVSGFGFGGINAHVVLEEWRGERDSGFGIRDSGRSGGRRRESGDRATEDLLPPREAAESELAPAIAVVGIAAHVGSCSDLAMFTARALGDGPLPASPAPGAPRPESRPRIPNPEFRIPQLHVPLGKYRIPPLELAEMLPQQLLMLDAACAAMEDAGVAVDDAPPGGRTDLGVFIGIELDENTTRFHLRWAMPEQARRWARERGVADEGPEFDAWLARLKDAVSPPLSANRTMGALGGIVASRVARLLRAGGPGFTISSEETSGVHAVAAAMRALQRGELRVALAGAVDLPAETVDADGDAALADAAAAVVLKRLEDAVADGDRVYAVVRGFAATSGNMHGDAPDDAVLGACRECEIDASAVGLVVSDDGSASAMLAESGPNEPRRAFADVTAPFGRAGAATGMLALVAGCVALNERRLPVAANAGDDGATFVATAPQHWLHNRASGPRRAAVVSRSVGGGTACVMLEEASFGDSPWGGTGGSPTRAAGRASFDRHVITGGQATHATVREALFLVAGGSTAVLLASLDRLETAVRQADAIPLDVLAARWWRENNVGSSAACIAIVARSVGELLAAIAEARSAASSGSAIRGDRVVYSPTPLLAGEGTPARDRLAFVYPGAGNQFLGMGRDWAVDWPGVMRRLEAENERLADQFAAGRFWTARSREEIREGDVAFGQVWLGSLVTEVVAQFGVRPGAAIGYSLGESAALFSLRAWTDRDEMLRRMQRSPLFTTELAGPCNAARRAWNLPANAAVDWRLGMVDRPAEEVRRALVGRERVCLLIVNTPHECVIGGARAAVERLVGDLGCVFHAIEGVTTVHCEVARGIAEDYRALHLLPTFPPENVRFYSGAWGQHYELSRETAADSILAQAVAPFDFTKVVERAYADGARVFVEMGPGASCTRMIGQTLGSTSDTGRFVAIPLCVAGQAAHGSLLRVLATLAAEGYPVDLAPLYGDAEDYVQRIDAGRNEGESVAIEVHRTLPDLATIADPASASIQPSAQGGAWGGTGSASAEFRTHFPSSRDSSRARDPKSDIQEAKASSRPSTGRASATPRQNDAGASPRELLAVAERQSRLVGRVVETEREKALAERQFLEVASGATLAVARARAWQATTSAKAIPGSVAPAPRSPCPASLFPESRIPNPESSRVPSHQSPAPVLDREQCLEFAIGSIAEVLGPQFAEVDSFPTRVRLPDEPLMLVDRITEIEGEACSLSSGRVVTEHDVLDGAWYLDGGRIPTCIAVEAGQADLFLSGYLGIDLRTRGLAVYRLLDAVVTFHGPLPTAGQTIQYDIRIDRFFRQGETYLFKFRFDATVDGESLLTMRDGCAGFFTEAELAAGQGIIQTTLDRREQPGTRPDDWHELAPMEAEAYGDEQLAALRDGNLAACFGEAFAALPIARPETIPGGAMTLVHRVLRLDPAGGRFGLGQIVGEADIHPDDWFLTCHFVDDQVMPGTLMYECCLHTLRIFLLRMGWIAEAGRVAHEPVPGVSSQLKCRGQVTAATQRVQYEITLKELGYAGDEETPYVLADALMYADGKPIVQMNNMSLRMSGAQRREIESLWSRAPRPKPRAPLPQAPAPNPQPLFNTDRILAFAIGKPSEAFGEAYRVFDSERVIARLPGPPYQFLDRIASIAGCRPFELAAGGEIDAEYDVPADAWYFAADRQAAMPFAVLLEVALQPCGWLAAYVGSALASDVDLSFRNLGGRGVQRRLVTPESGTLATRVKMTDVSKSGGMIIQNYDMTVRDRHGVVYEGDTYFGFFSKAALANQVGIRDVRPYERTDAEVRASAARAFPADAPLPDAMMRMVDRIEVFDPSGGPHGLGIIRGATRVDPAAWFFKAHFYQDPVWPGSLGLESFLQMLKFAAVERWGDSCRRRIISPTGVPSEWDRRKDSPPTQRSAIDSPQSHQGVVFESMALEQEHKWTYRGQILPTDRQVVVQAAITGIDDAQRRIEADGCLWVDGRLIYQMERFAVRMPEQAVGHRR
ncbi:MAG: type I polyketide synthase [Planctomycetota bacterium]|nr:MAG: type I polyketide synthase [Planctomycetota bacterium]